MQRSPTPYLVLGTVALCWSGGWIMIKVGVSAAPPLEFAAVRFVGASLLLLLILGLTGRAPARRPVGALASSGLIGYFGYNALVFVGLTMTPVSDAALIVPTTIPALTAVAAVLVGERATRRAISGLIVATLGAALVVGGGQVDPVAYPQRLLGDLLLLGGAVCWAIYTVLGTITARYGSSLAALATSTIIGAILLFPLGFLEHGYADVGTWTLGTWLAEGYVTVVQAVFSFVLFFWAVGRYGASLASLTSYLVPLGTLALAIIVLGERPAPLQWVGGAVILVGVRLAARGGTRTRAGGDAEQLTARETA